MREWIERREKKDKIRAGKVLPTELVFSQSCCRLFCPLSRDDNNNNSPEWPPPPSSSGKTATTSLPPTTRTSSRRLCYCGPQLRASQKKKFQTFFLSFSAAALSKSTRACKNWRWLNYNSIIRTDQAQFSREIIADSKMWRATEKRLGENLRFWRTWCQMFGFVLLLNEF